MLERAWSWAVSAALLLLGGSLLLTGCGRGAHADQPKKLSAPELPLVKDGYIYPLNGPGLGTQLIPDLFKRQDAIVRRSGA